VYRLYYTRYSAKGSATEMKICKQ